MRDDLPQSAAVRVGCEVPCLQSSIANLKSEIPTAVPARHAIQIRSDAGGEEREQCLALLGGGGGRVADVPRLAAVRHDPRPVTRAERLAVRYLGHLLHVANHEL